MTAPDVGRLPEDPAEPRTVTAHQRTGGGNVRQLRITLACAMVLALLVAAAAPAGAESVSDPNDVRGKLDLHQLSGTKAGRRQPLHIRLSMYDPIHRSSLTGRSSNRLFILFDVDRDPRLDYRGRVTGGRGGFGLNISGQGSRFETIKVRHPDRYTFTMTVPGNSPPNPTGRVGLGARSLFFGARVCRHGCRDRVPEGGWLTVSPG